MRELDRFVERSVQQDSPIVSSEVMSGLFDQFVEEQILLKAAEDAGIEADPKVVAERLEALQTPTPIGSGSSTDAGVDEEDADATAPRSTISTDEDALVRDLTKQVRIERLLDAEALSKVKVSDEEVASYFEAHREDYVRPETVDVSQILVESEDEAREIRKRILAKKATFEDLAREKSQGPEAESGGHLGAFAPGELPPSFEQEVFSLKPGALSDVVPTDFGFHIFRVNWRTEGKPLELEEAEPSVRVELLRRKSDEAMKRYLADLERRYPVKIYHEHLSFAVVDHGDSASVAPGSETERETVQ